MENRVQRLLIYGFPVPPGYTQATVDLYLRIESGYPDAQIDMVYVYPPLTKTNGSSIAALASEQFDNRTWQRWSRHRTAAHPWRPGLDNVDTHLGLVAAWFTQEAAR